MFVCICMSAGVCRVPSHHKCEPTKPILLRAGSVHTKIDRLVQAEGLTVWQDGRDSAADPRDL